MKHQVIHSIEVRMNNTSYQYKKLNKLFDANQWIKDGWQMFKKDPIAWIVMLLIFDFLLIIGSTHYIARYISTLLLPILTGGIYLSAHNSQQGKIVSVKDLFLMFSSLHRKTLKELLIIGGVGVLIALINGSLLGVVLMVLWSFILLFAVPLVVIKNEQAIPAMKNAVWASISNLIPILIFYFLSLILLVVTTIAGVVGLLIVIPILFGASYSSYNMVFGASDTHQEQLGATGGGIQQPIEPTAAVDNNDKVQPNLGDKLIEWTNARMLGETNSEGEVIIPNGFEIKYYDEYMHIIRHWHGFSTFILIISAVVINGILIANDFWGLLMSDRELLLRLFALTFIGMGVLMPYVAIANWLNKTHIYVSKDAIEIKHQPIPWFGNKRVETNNIKQLSVEKKGGGSQGISSSRNQPKYYVIAHTDNGETFNLIKGLSRSNHAFYIEQRIESYLGIEDIALPEEFGHGVIKKDG